MIWKITSDLSTLNNISQGTAIENLGIRFIEIGDDYLRATMPLDVRTRQPLGLLHGGASALLAETLGSYASVLCIDNQESNAVGIELNISHLRAVTDGAVTGTVRPIRVGRRTHVWDIRIVNTAQEETAVSRLTMAIVPK